MKKILAVASGGGHWEQLSIVSHSFTGFSATYVTTIPGLPQRAGLLPAYIVRDTNRNKPLQTILCSFELLRIVLRIRPDIVITTGAAPGLIALVLGKLVLAKCVWIDSVANSEELSLSGRIATKLADVCLTQWQHLAAENGPRYIGSVL